MVYLITCQSCDKQYVGETTQPLHKRVNGHRSDVKAKSSTFLYQHFNQPGHDFSNASIQIIDFVDSNISSDIKNDLKLLEDDWIDKLGTAFPLGLNDNKKGTGNISQDKKVDYFNGKLPRYRRGHGKRRKSPKIGKTMNVIVNDINTFKNCLLSSSRDVYTTLKSYNLKDLDVLYSLSQSNSGLVYNVCSSFCSAFSPKYQHKLSTSPKVRENIIIQFNCKFIDKINFKSIVGDTSVIKSLPAPLQHVSPLQVFYRYNDPVSLSVCNYGTFLKKLNMYEIKQILDSPCCCSTRPCYYR